MTIVFVFTVINMKAAAMVGKEHQQSTKSRGIHPLSARLLGLMTKLLLVWLLAGFVIFFVVTVTILGESFSSSSSSLLQPRHYTSSFSSKPVLRFHSPHPKPSVTTWTDFVSRNGDNIPTSSLSLSIPSAIFQIMHITDIHLWQPEISGTIAGQDVLPHNYTRRQLLDIDASFGLSLTQSGPLDVTGASNYVLQAMSDDTDDDDTTNNAATKVALEIYFLDSGGGALPQRIDASQVHWLQQQLDRRSNTLLPAASHSLSTYPYHVPPVEYKWGG